MRFSPSCTTGLGLAASEPVAPYAGKDTFPLSDGSVSLVLETADSAGRAGVRVPYCRVRGYGMAHSDVPFGTVGGSSEGLVKAVRAALADAELTAADIDGILGFANGMTEVDSQETAGLSAVFDLSRVPVLSVKQRTGEGRAASAALALAHGAFLLHGDLDTEPDAYLGSPPARPAWCRQASPQAPSAACWLCLCSRRLVHGGRDREGSLTGDGRGTGAPGSTYYTQETSHL